MLTYDLRGDSPEGKRKQWIQSDVQITVGYMHAGYPICKYHETCFQFFVAGNVTNMPLCQMVGWSIGHTFSIQGVFPI